MNIQPQWWIVTVAGYGSFAIFDTVENAEVMRRHKSAWEGGVGKKRKADFRRTEDKRLVAQHRQHMGWR